MTEITVTKENGAYRVTVNESSGSTEHIVTVDDSYYQKLIKGKITPEQLIEKSFVFLLAREPKESILKEFNLSVIEKYFPEYEKEVNV